MIFVPGNRSGCGSETRPGGRTPGPSFRNAEIGIHPRDEFLETLHDLRVLWGHVLALADIVHQIIKAWTASLLLAAGLLAGFAFGLGVDGQFPRTPADRFQAISVEIVDVPRGATAGTCR